MKQKRAKELAQSLFRESRSGAGPGEGDAAPTDPTDPTDPTASPGGQGSLEQWNCGIPEHREPRATLQMGLTGLFL